jgi:hypothetical protein
VSAAKYRIAQYGLFAKFKNTQRKTAFHRAMPTLERLLRSSLKISVDIEE